MWSGCWLLVAADRYEGPGSEHPGHRVALGHKQAVVARLRTLAEDAGLRDPADLAQQLLLLMDGAWVAARMFGPHNPGVQVAAAARARSGRTTAEPGSG